MDYSLIVKLKGEARYKALAKSGWSIFQITLAKLGDDYLDFTEAEMHELKVCYGSPELDRINKRIAEYQNSIRAETIGNN